MSTNIQLLILTVPLQYLQKMFTEKKKNAVRWWHHSTCTSSNAVEIHDVMKSVATSL